MRSLSRLRASVAWVVSALALSAALGLTPATAGTDSASAASAASAWVVPTAFTTGLKALDRHRIPAVDQAIADLGDGPLAIYLSYRLLYDSLANAKRVDDALLAKAGAFLDAHPDFVFRHRLEARYLRGLAAQKHWAAFLALLDKAPGYTDSTAFGCLSLQAHIETNTMDARQIRLARAIWSRGWSQPDSCDPVFSWLAHHHHLDAALYRKRIRSAVERGHTGLARYLARRGGHGAERYLHRWLLARTDPEKVLRQALARYHHGAPDHVTRDRLVKAMAWLARSEPVTAHELLARIPASWHWPSAARADLARRIALKAGYQHLPQAYDWLMALPKSVRSEEVLTWTARSALRGLDWAGVQKAIARMPATLAAEPEWQYWQARSDAQLGQSLAAEKRYRTLVSEHGYYGLLAADRLGIDYAWPESTAGVSSVEDEQARARRMAALDRQPVLQLAFILHAAGQYDDARAAFMQLLKEVPAKSLPDLARLAERANWYDRVAVVVARMDGQERQHWFAARYPMPWRQQVDRASTRQDISPDWLYAVVRRESLFMADVGSHAGAQGLMQLMPRTARWINRKADLHLHSLDLHDPGTSIRLGAAYLRYLADRFPQQRPVAIAAYNAGPGRVKQWLPKRPLPADVWVDTIVYDETRAYTRAVLTGSVIYAWRRGATVGHGMRLTAMMPIIGGTEVETADAEDASGRLTTASR